MNVSPPKTIKLSEYQKTPYIIETVQLKFEIFHDHAKVINTLKMKQRPGRTGEALCLNGENQQLLSVSIDGNLLSKDEYALTDESLTIENPGQDFELVICSTHKPKDNTSFMGLYMSQDNYFTQCEAEGFRRITYYYDRPDCMSVFTTRIEADKKSLPVLLSNGNKIDSGDLEQGRHFCSYFDPFPKPAYLFALVAADLPKISDSYQTGSGQNVELEIYARANDIEKCHFAMASLKRAMKWDEEFYGLECDLNAFKIVAVSDFNFGAMENKGLNIFNTSAVLASPATTTDSSFLRVESVVAHEYFHNWSGNRVTCQNWFQLCLKEGLTVFRDQEFTSTMHSRGVNRIEMVAFLKERQFTEDAGPLAHPVRPEEYIQIDNFYTMTIYEKGAEICRLIHTLLGPEKYRQGVDCYFSRHDGQAVTVEDFIKSMSDGSGKDLSKVMEWYKHPGTPMVHASGNYDRDSKTYTLTLRQSNPKSPEAPPLVMPVIMGLIGKSGHEQDLILNGVSLGKETTLLFEQSEELFEFTNIEQEVVPSIFRQLSAPVKIDAGYNEDDLLHLMKYDSDEFNRYQATQELYMVSLLKMVDSNAAEVDERLIKAFQTVLSEAKNEPAVAALTLTLPSEAKISQEMDVIDVEAICAAREAMKKTFAKNSRELLEETYHWCLGTDPQSISTENVGKRSLLNITLSYLASLDDQASWSLVKSQLDQAQNMTEEMAAFVNMVHSECSYKNDAIASFYQKWQHEDLLINSWFGEQAAANIDNNLSNVRRLVEHSAFSFTNPNRLRALAGGFCSSMRNFHAIDGSGYEFLADIILKVDQLNSKTAARLSSAFAQWKKFPDTRQAAMKKQLERILETKGLSNGTYEMISRTLKK
jgi:aminopeptidase N